MVKSRETTTLVVMGTGSIGFRHLQLLAREKKGRVLALPVRPERRRELAGAGYATAITLQESWAQGARACVVATDTGRHLNDAQQALQMGFDILVEKPLSIDSLGAQQLLRTAKKANKKVFTACVLRFSRSLGLFKHHVGQLGKIHYVRIICQSYLPDWRPARDYWNSYSARPEEGGVLRDLIHDIDYAGWIFGWPKMVQARLVNSHTLKIQAEESADLLWKAPSGSIVSIHLDYLTRPTQRRMTAFGQNGTLEWDGVKNTVMLWTPKGGIFKKHVKQDRNEMFARQLKEFQNTVFREKKPVLLATGEDGLRALAVCDAARRSSSTKTEEKVRY